MLAHPTKILHMQVDAPDAAGVTPLQLAVGSRLAVVLHAASRAPAEMAARLQEVCVHGAPGGVLPLGPGGGGQLPFGSGAPFDGGGGGRGSSGGFDVGGGGGAARGASQFGPAGEGFGGPPAGSSPGGGGSHHGALQGGGPTIAEQQVSARAAAAAVKEQAKASAAATVGDRQVIIELRPQAPQGSGVQRGGPKGSSPPAPGAEQSFDVRPHAASQGLSFGVPPGSFGMEPAAFGSRGDRGSPLGLGGLALANKPAPGSQAHGALPLGALSILRLHLCLLRTHHQPGCAYAGVSACCHQVSVNASVHEHNHMRVLHR